jgi:hypothetical protein
MPTYEYRIANKTDRTVTIRDINGNNQIVPVESIGELAKTSDTFYSTGASGEYPELTKISDAPYYNPVVAEESVSGATIVTILETCKKVVVKNIVGTGDMFYQASANTPGTPLDGLSIIAESVNNHFTKLVFTTSGTLTCDVIQYDREDIEVA